MKIEPKKDKDSKSNNVGLRVVFSEKALIALLNVILALGIAQFQSQNSVNQEIPAKASQEQLN